MSLEQEPAAGGDLAYGANRKSIACSLMQICSQNVQLTTSYIAARRANERAVHYVTRDVMCTND